MKHRLVILTEIISPYRIPLFNTLARSESIDLHVMFLAETDPTLRQWKVYKEEIKFSFQVLPSWRKHLGGYNALLNRGVGAAFTEAAPDAILCGGYNYLASWQALVWARSRRIPFLLWSESNRQDLRRGLASVEFLKSRFLARCCGFVVPGPSALEYLTAQGIAQNKIFTAPNAVDNSLFTTAAARARQDEQSCRRALGLPERYFLFVGRLVREKGVFDLLTAYARLDESVRLQCGLVFVGDGLVRQQLEEQAASVSPGMVRFTGFAQREQLAQYYALAEALILPTYTDTWGLVVNEAMACSLPVIVSRAAGCAADLVKENCNGFLVPTRDVPALASAMTTIARQPELCRAMSTESLRLISQYSPAQWAEGVVHGIETIKGERG